MKLSNFFHQKTLYLMGIFPLAFILVLVIQRFNFDNPLEVSKSWPSPIDWQRLNENVEGRLLQVNSPLDKQNGDSSSLNHLLKNLHNPFVIQEYPWGTQSTGWLDAWSTEASPYAVAASNTSDIIAAVKFAKEHHLKLAIKGTGHDYLGRSNASQSLLVWTHNMRNVTVHNAFIPVGAPIEKIGLPAVTIEAGARWIEVYQEVTTKHGRYVQGGGCTTVGAVGGFLQGGGFGSFSKKYGIAAASLLEAEVVIANGDVLIANQYQNADLFWALKGGGGGTFGVVTKATLETHELPSYAGIFQAKIIAHTDEMFKELIEYFINFYRKNLNNEHWGEQMIVKPDNCLDLWLVFQGLNQNEVENIWKPFQDWAAQQSGLYIINFDFTFIPPTKLWDYEYFAQNLPDLVKSYSSQNGNFFYWTPNEEEVLAYWYTYQSRWIPIALFEKESSKEFANTLFEASRYWEVALHFNKGLAGASSAAIKRSKDTSMHPMVLDAAALAICGAFTHNVFPGLQNHEPDIKKGLEKIQKVNHAMKIISLATPNSGSYLNETNYFQKNWQQDLWGEHYPRLLKAKQKYDPENLFKCHHCIGSEE